MQIEYVLDDIGHAAKKAWAAIAGNKVIAFHGGMGAGKTTFIHALCEAKGVQDAVTSPTFSIINEYLFIEKGIPGKIFHIDLFRLKDEREAIRAGVEDCLFSDHSCFVEWPEHAPGLLPAGTLHLYFEVCDAQTRRLTIQDK